MVNPADEEGWDEGWTTKERDQIYHTSLLDDDV